jgi:hypothetical protein
MVPPFVPVMTINPIAMVVPRITTDKRVGKEGPRVEVKKRGQTGLIEPFDLSMIPIGSTVPVYLMLSGPDLLCLFPAEQKDEEPDKDEYGAGGEYGSTSGQKDHCKTADHDYKCNDIKDQ